MYFKVVFMEFIRCWSGSRQQWRIGGLVHSAFEPCSAFIFSDRQHHVKSRVLLFIVFWDCYMNLVCVRVFLGEERGAGRRKQSEWFGSQAVGVFRLTASVMRSGWWEAGRPIIFDAVWRVILINLCQCSEETDAAKEEWNPKLNLKIKCFQRTTNLFWTWISDLAVQVTFV